MTALLLGKSRLFCWTVAAFITVAAVFPQTGFCFCIGCCCPSNVAGLFRGESEETSPEETACCCCCKGKPQQKKSDENEQKSTIVASQNDCCSNNPENHGCSCSEKTQQPVLFLNDAFNWLAVQFQQGMVSTFEVLTVGDDVFSLEWLTFCEPPPLRLHLLLLVLLN